jgi:hypothetical protein
MMLPKRLAWLAITLSLSIPAAVAQDDADLAPDDAAGPSVLDPGGELTDAERDLRDAMDVADVSAPLAFGVVYSNGAKQSGTANWSSTYNSTYNRYEISISGTNYYYVDFATVITPAGDNRFCRSSSVSGKLLVYCYDANGAGQTARFGFITFRP